MSPTVAELPVAQAAALPELPPEVAWLVRSIWSYRAVGFASGQPKVGKTFFVADLALSVASNTPCLGTFPVEDPGPALVYFAEDPLPRIRDRLVALAQLRDVALARVPLHVITAPSIRLDEPDDRDRLAATVARLRPRLLVLDPLVRIHSGDENDARYIASLLGFLRHLSREYALAITVVHHMAKRQRRQLGQSLRGSSDLWAWADSSAYLTRTPEQILLTLEHRSAPAPDPIPLRLSLGPDGQCPHLEPAPNGPSAAPGASSPVADSIPQRALALLRDANGPLSRTALRKALRVQNHRLGQALATLEHAGHVARSGDGWRVVVASAQTPLPFAD
jgi:hypothetical protein